MGLRNSGERPQTNPLGLIALSLSGGLHAAMWTSGGEWVAKTPLLRAAAHHLGRI